jgi:RNA polymerase sigma-70 factor (ECF subfamily)
MRVAKGDEDAFAILFHFYHNRLANYVQRFTNSILLTEEIVQDVFLKIWTNRVELSTVSNFRSYLFVSSRNHAFNAIKKLAREYRRNELWQMKLKEEFDISLERTSYQEVLATVQQAIQALPPQQKKVFLLSREKGMSHDEIARQLGLSPTTVKKHVFLALKFLRERVGPHTTTLILVLLLDSTFL